MLRWIAVSLLVMLAVCSAKSREENWGQWRGPEGNGVSRTSVPPVEWGKGKNVRWTAEVDGSGTSTPIVWGEKVFVLTAINTGKVDPTLPKPEEQPKRVFGITHPNTSYEFVALCLNRETGEEMWRRKAAEEIPHEGHHRDNSFASASPTTDGERLYCWFGSAGLFCYDLQGEKLWERQLGEVKMGASLGEGCSPVLHDGKLIIVRDHQGQSSIEVLDAVTGKDVWRKERDEPNGWATPAVVEFGGKTQVITSGANLVRSYDLANGEIIWQCGGLTENAIPCPVVEDGVVYCMTGYQGYSVLAISLDSEGDVTGGDAVVWSRDRGTPYIPSPLLYDGLLYYNQSNQNILSCVKAKDGAVVIDRERLDGVPNIYASPVGADGRVYVVGRNGTVFVLKLGGEFEVLAVNELDDTVHASPALSGKQLFLRGRNTVYCIADED